MKKPGANLLRTMLTRNQQLASETLEEGFPLAQFETLQAWQLGRLTKTFEDLYSHEGYRPAVEFFVSDLYGGMDFRERDQEMERVLPIMVRFLPDNALVALAEAFELQAISIEYDVLMARFMDQAGMDGLSMPDYCEVYLNCSDRGGRERQIQLISKLGQDLQKLVNKPVINYLLRMLRGPAHAAGFGLLQEFLESGFASFRALEDADHFVDTIYEREWATMERLFSGDPDPFRLQESYSQNAL
jgi:hypothetical protein